MASSRSLLKKPRKKDEDLLDEDRQRSRLRRTAREARQMVQALEKELHEYKTRTAFLDRAAALPPPKPYAIRRKGSKKGRLPQATYVMPASDWHMGERVRPETVQWRNEYNPEIAQERAEQFFRSNLKILTAARSIFDVRQGILWLGGDLMTGYIHEEYEEDNFLSPTEESLLVFDTLNRGLKFLLDRSDLEEILIPTDHGNHSRTGKKLRISTAARNSFEWMLYQYLKRHWKDEPRLKFQIASGYHNVVDIYGFGIRFHHGEQVGYQGGIGGLSIPVNKRIGRQAQGEHRIPKPVRGAPIRLDVIGHFHSLQYPKDFIVNGSLIGWNAYAESKGFGYEEPMQASFVVDEEHRLVSNFNPILVKR